jgi:hypothetical protein
LALGPWRRIALGQPLNQVALLWPLAYVGVLTYASFFLQIQSCCKLQERIICTASLDELHIHATSYRESTCFHCRFILEDQSFLLSLSICRRGHCFRPSSTTPLGVGRRSIELFDNALAFLSPLLLQRAYTTFAHSHLVSVVILIRCPCSSSSTSILILI